MQYAEFRSGFIWTSLVTAIIGGFAFGAYLAVVIGYGLPAGQSFYALIQTHGHLQLIGWVGVFIMGISLHFIPRLASFPLPRPERMSRILWLMVPGLLLRAIGAAILPALEGSPVALPLRWLVVASGALEGGAMILYVSFLIETMRGSDQVRRLPALGAVKPYFGMMAAGWLLYAGLNLFLVLRLALGSDTTIDQGWNEFAIATFMNLTLLPVAFALSVRLFPLYLALPAPDWPVYRIGCAYLLAVCMQVIPIAPPLAGLAPHVTRLVVALGALMKGSVILWFVWQLDLLTRRRPLGRHARFLDTGPDRPPTRPGLPDYGEFGRFERLVYAAYTWLVLAAFIELLHGMATLLGYSISISADAIRHMYVLGFITHLIFGASVRMLPGFIRKKRVASTGLVDATFWLGSTAGICRVVPLLSPSWLSDLLPGGGILLETLFAISGLLGWGAVACLAMNLRRTAVSTAHRFGDQGWGSPGTGGMERRSSVRMGAPSFGIMIGVAGLIGLGLLGNSAAVEPHRSSTDTRQRLVLAPAQRDMVLAEMRQMLASVSGIAQGLATENLAGAEQAARASGMAAAADVDPHIKPQLPQHFLELAMNTHRGFDVLANRIKAGRSQADILSELAKLTGNCVACHAVYRLDEAR